MFTPESAGSASPAAFLFHPAWPAVSGMRIPAPLRNRQTGGNTCRSGETTCPQSGWCCGAGETCSSISGAFFCCPSGVDTASCTRVCAAGDFQCGSICCADGQTCGGADLLSPFCTNQSRTRESGADASATTASSSSFSSSTPTTSTDAATTTTPPSTTPSTTTAAQPPTTPTTTPATQPAPSPSPPQQQQAGLPHAGQIAIGIIVPVAVVLLVGALWFLVFRRPRTAHRPHRRWGTGATTSSSFSFGSPGGGGGRITTPPPAYSKSGGVGVAVGVGGRPAAGLSLHERYILESNAERGRRGGGGGGEGVGYEMGDLEVGTGGRGGMQRQRGAGPEVVGVGPEDMSPLSADSRVDVLRERASPHPGTVVVV